MNEFYVVNKAYQVVRAAPKQTAKQNYAGNCKYKLKEKHKYCYLHQYKAI